MLPIAFIRNSVFQTTQREFAELAGTSQATVSRWEQGELAPDVANLERIRHAAQARNLEWDDSWFFVTPTERTAP
jgi:transcriptional regulator with XRE-family HTH domain